ncbi:hypothetical protein OCU04_000214 [Sclerotinia nivalis]|uniref:BZIP domain-containing protein n=1 Tax=Sclerotinia nivalis TaxID=352851 RepID=A0A9X0DR29_9HELO|nr:hypothetical protein OCU04_000214 [Sclerotinia nivalis]
MYEVEVKVGIRWGWNVTLDYSFNLRQLFSLKSSKSFIERQFKSMENPRSVEPIQGRKIAGTLEYENSEREPLQPRRKRGRPRIEASEDAKLSKGRRLQNRAAQKTHRQKKEAALEGYKTRIAELEQKLAKTTELLSKCYESTAQSNLQETHPEVSVQLSRLHGHLFSRPDRLSQFSSKQSIAVNEQNPPQVSAFGYHDCSNFSVRTPSMDSSIETSFSYPINQDGLGMTPSRLRSEERIFGGSITYSFHEPMFSRRLQRYCLEHAYRLFINPRSDPKDIYRLFRLVPCIRDKAQMAPYFNKLVRAGANESLEMQNLPFYAIGGAGKHFPRKDEWGNSIASPNTRLPRRLLGLPPRDRGGHRVDEQDERETQLRTLGFDGEWFDCADVQGYLEGKGIFLTDSSPFNTTDVPIDIAVTGLASTGRGFQSCNLHGGNALAIRSAGGESTMLSSSPNTPMYNFDVDHFMMMIMPGLAMLGRAPGFKRAIVESAFLSVMQM